MVTRSTSSEVFFKACCGRWYDATYQIFLAGYYCACDLLLIYQWWYYGKYYRNGKYIGGSSGEQARLLETPPEPTQEPVGRATAHTYDTLVRVTNEWMGRYCIFGKYAIAGFLVVITGVVAWVHSGSKNNSPPEEVTLRWDAQTLGWLSAFLYLSSRFPQIEKNRHTKCMGLSLALFVFSLMGNLTYVLSIMFLSIRPSYLIENSSWLVGSLGTIFLDFVVLGQFVVYAPARREMMVGRVTHTP